MTHPNNWQQLVSDSVGGSAEAIAALARVFAWGRGGVLIHGSTGTGKTLLATTAAQRSGRPVFVLECSSVFRRNSGEAEAAMMAFLGKAAAAAPSVVVLDQLHMVCARRERAASVTDIQVTSVLLETLDEWSSAQLEVVVIATALTPALLDPSILLRGRLETHVALLTPSVAERVAILAVHTRGMPLEAGALGAAPAAVLRLELLRDIAARCHGYVGSDLQHLCTEAATRAAMEAAPAVLRRHFEAALAQGRPAALTAQSVGVRDAPGVTLRDVHGCAQQVAEVRVAVLTPLERPDLLRRLGIAAPGGVLLHGPSGCGKTLLARAVAGEAAHLANFIPVQCSELVDKVVGRSEAAVARLFAAARAAAPCILFLDQVESVAAARGTHSSSHGTMDRVLSTLLIEMDGAAAGGSSSSSSSGVIVIAATTDPAWLDPAILRPGRLETHVAMGAPDAAARALMFAAALRRVPLAPGEDAAAAARWLARRAAGFTGADVARACREAAMAALRESLEAQYVCRRHFEPFLPGEPTNDSCE